MNLKIAEAIFWKSDLVEGFPILSDFSREIMKGPISDIKNLRKKY